MQVKAVIDKAYTETEVHVCSRFMTSSVENLVQDISKMVNANIVGTDERGEKVVLILKDVVRFYAENQRVFAQDEKGIYSIAQKLYELEEQLMNERFMRISKSEIINLSKIKRLDMSITGTIKVIMRDGTETYTSRRNVVKLKKQLGL